LIFILYLILFKILRNFKVYWEICWYISFYIHNIQKLILICNISMNFSICYFILVVSWGKLLHECILLCTRSKREISAYFTKIKSTSPLTWGPRKRGLYVAFLLPTKPAEKRWRRYVNALRIHRENMLWKHSMYIFNYYSK